MLPIIRYNIFQLEFGVFHLIRLTSVKVVSSFPQKYFVLTFHRHYIAHKYRLFYVRFVRLLFDLFLRFFHHLLNVNNMK